MQKKRKTVAAQIKAEAAIAMRNAEKAMREAASAREAEDKYWKEAEGPKSRAALKREEAANKRAEAIARKAETRRLEEEEKTSKKKTTGNNVNKAEDFKRRRSRTVSEKEYEKMVVVKNTNADSWTVEESLSSLSIDSTPLTTRLETFEKKNLILLKETKPGLTNEQYDDMLDKLWARSHLNPHHQTRIKH